MNKAVATLEILDEVNVRFRRLDVKTLKQCSDMLAYWAPGYFFAPKFKAGWWDGKIRLFNATTGHTYFNLLHLVLPFIETMYDLEVIDHRKDYSSLIEKVNFVDENFFSEFEITDIATGITGPLMLREHQVNAINSVIEHGSGLFVIATGGGKSLCCAALSKIYSATGNVVVIVPTIDLVIQTRRTFRNVGIDCGIWYGGEKDRKQVTMSTWQSLEAYEELFDGTNTVIVDEVQGAKAKVLGEILAGPAANVPFRFGCTGTLPKEDLAMVQINGVVGMTRSVTTSRDLQNIGLLAEAEVHQIMLNDRDNPSYTAAVGGKAKNAREESKYGHDDWNAELDWFANQADRMDWIASFLREIAADGNTFVVIERKYFIEKLRALIPEAYVMTGDDDAKKVRVPMLQKFAAGENGILICTPGVGAVGLDAPSIRNVVPIELGKATIKIMQTMGRGLRPIPGKLLMLYDIYGNAKLSKKHAMERRKAFETYGQIVHQTEASYL